MNLIKSHKYHLFTNIDSSFWLVCAQSFTNKSCIPVPYVSLVLDKAL